jgi:hypothetical protein
MPSMERFTVALLDIDGGHALGYMIDFQVGRRKMTVDTRREYFLDGELVDAWKRSAAAMLGKSVEWIIEYEVKG